MRRTLLNVLTLCSLLLCEAVVVLWVETRLRETVWSVWSRPIYTANGGIEGRVEVFWWRDGLSIQVGTNAGSAQVGTLRQGWRVPGVRVERRWGRTRGVDVEVSHWLLACATGLLPSFRAVLLFVRRRRRPDGHCRACGYDLRATPQRCPECGATRPLNS